MAQRPQHPHRLPCPGGSRLGSWTLVTWTLGQVQESVLFCRMFVKPVREFVCYGNESRVSPNVGFLRTACRCLRRTAAKQRVDSVDQCAARAAPRMRVPKPSSGETDGQRQIWTRKEKRTTFTTDSSWVTAIMVDCRRSTAISTTTATSTSPSVSWLFSHVCQPPANHFSYFLHFGLPG